MGKSRKIVYVMIEEFKEIGHSGGKITFTFKTDSDGRHACQVRFSTNSPVPVALIGVYALAQGVPVIITSDSQG